MTRNIINHVLAVAVLAASWFCLIGFPGSDGKLEGGYAIKATVHAYCNFVNPQFEECK